MKTVDAALAYARNGWLCFPVRADKKPYTEHGFKDATTDPETIRAWWEKWPNANVGVRTGAESGIWVVDVDNTANTPTLPKTMTAVTGRGGKHYVFKHPGGSVKTNASRLAAGVDVRGDGGYIVAPPSVHENGNQYRWEPGCFEPVEAPPELVARVIKAAPVAIQVARKAFPPADEDTLDQARASLRAHGPAIQGKSGDPHTYHACAILLNDFALTPDEALPLLEEWNAQCVPPWPLDELRVKINSSIKSANGEYGRYRIDPLRVEWHTDGDPLTVAPVEDENEDSPSDLGNALLFARLAGDSFRYVTEWKSWLEWRGTRWARDEGSGSASRAMIKIGDHLKKQSQAQSQQAARLEQELASLTRLDSTVSREDEVKQEALRDKIGYIESKAKSYRARIQMLHSAAGLASALRVAQIDSRLGVAAARIDADQFTLNCANGTLDLRTGEHRAHNRDDLLTRITPVEYDPAAECPAWDDFLTATVAPDVADFLQRAVGYTLTGSVTAQCLFFLFGNGANGKSTFVNVVRALMGDYAQTGASSLLESAPGKHPTDVADLCSARMVTLTETESNRAFPSALVKTLTSEEPVKARKMGQDFWQFQPTHKLWISGNHKPQIPDTDDGIWRRIQLIPFTRTVAVADRDPNLTAKLCAELPGILNWAIAGCQRWLADGHLQPTETILSAGDEYRKEEDCYRAFVEEMCEVSDRWTVGRTQLFAAFDGWIKLANARVRPSRNRFYTEMGRLGFRVVHMNGQRVIRGVKLAGT